MIPPNLTLYIIRHGECEHNIAGRAAGQDDSPLTPKGREQARDNGRLLARLVSSPLDQLRFFSSPLHRTCTTMELLLEEIGLPQNQYRSDRRLMEGDLGDHTGLPGPAMLGHPDYVNSGDRWSYIRPNGESVAMVYERVGQFLSSLISDSVIVTHALPASMIRAHALGLLNEGVAFEISNTGILRVSSGKATLF